MVDLTEKVEALERRLDKLSNVFDYIRKSLTTESPKRHHSVRTKALGGRPEWVEEIVQHFNEISAELKSVKETLDTRSMANSEAAREAQLQHEAPSQRQGAEQGPPAIPENRQRESVAANAPEPMRRPSPASPPGQNIMTKDTSPQAHQVPVGCEVSPTPSTSTEPLHHTTQLNDALLDPQSEEGSAPMFHCNYDDISGNLNEAKLVQFSSNPRVRRKGYFKLAVEGLPPLNVEEAYYNQPGKGHCTNFSCQPDSRGCVKVTKKQNQEIKFPGFPLPESQTESWSQRSLKEFWESTLKDPPQDMVYVIGDPLFPDIELSPGEGLKRIDGYKKLRGIGTKYVYLGFGVSCSIMHGEDAKFRSMNLLRSGEHKLWLVVEPIYEKELELRMRQEFPKMANCSQAVRHLSRVIAPSKLDEWKIPYSLDYCKPGEAIVTEPGAFHQVLNMGANYAIAINILYSSSPTVPKGYKFCQKSCDPHAITAAHLRLREKGGPLAEVQANQRTRLPQGSVTAVPPNIIPSKRKAIPAEPQSRIPLVTPHIGSLLEAVCGKEAFLHLCSLIRSWRDRSKPLFEIDKARPPAMQLVNVIGILGERSLLAEFLDRLARVKLADIIDDGKAGRSNADPSAITNLIRDLQWNDTQKSREKLRNYLKDGRKWKRICGRFDGLLCLIPPNREDKENPRRASGRMYQDLSDDDIQQFHSLLDSNQLIGPMCQVGNTFQASLWDNTVVPEFLWESEDPKEVARLPLNKLSPLIKKFQVIDANECHFEKHDWPKPDCWQWDWPQYPTWVPPSDKLCELCDLCEVDNPCNCITTCLPQIIPEITNEGKKGQGVRAIGTEYRKDQILGEFLGELFPLDTYHDGWPIEFIRPDLSEEPIAQIYPREMGNWVRKVNDSCAPSAKFRVMKISGWWRQMIAAVEDIPHNGEITASCGRNFLRGQGKECFCDVHS
ncbi:JmjC domain, hydroxylase-domain-containing protein [Tricladium varicosporioides]|nr:JmjC domain, hydroxylase-domain-containing protein [Hymenoscyphus varicosporioides]